MTNSKKNANVDWYFRKNKTRQQELTALRKIVVDCGLTEELKWGVPCYTLQNRNIVLLHVFKEYFALLFFKGALLQDPKHILIQQTLNVQAARQIRFQSAAEVVRMKTIVKAYIKEAIKVEKSGAQVKMKKASDFAVPEELKRKLEEMSDLKTAFAALTPGRQRAYILYFSAPKQSKTRESRIEKCMDDIFDGKGLHDV